MRWRDQRQSDNVEDRRGMGGGLALGGGGIGVIVLAIAIYMCGGDPSALLQNAPSTSAPQPGTAANKAAAPDENLQFGRAVIGSLEDAWKEILPAQSRTQFRKAKLVVFSGQVASACGNATAATGPFYCPGDYQLYLDFGFFEELKREFKAPGDFAQAYVIAHEVGHHVQHLLGITDKVHEARGNISEEEYNKLSVRLELQADFLAGVWAHHANELNDMIENGDFEEAINAASAIGDDRLQKKSQGRITPDSFTHGTSEQRVRWFTKGYKTGDTSQGDTFNTEDL